ncbi:thioredoxin domain-containing protein [Caldivirga maquilingensis]|uniref:Thiol:disulphide interchange protein, putative n=1 Tax=Caldivirga maquilingensis (strain ATCC 700844 / DSM 13496 / JCM 10307 / IC-167) TaxID=397948 RepID=A8MBP1_CALMQ|nr:thioredoxin domain-containing protein [Caldivirga maquilingensis]ABW02774.1 thiol:disulphide interchange protein, putative [Caldivirga maquilingensis IC-167]
MSDKWVISNVGDFLSKVDKYALKIKANGNAKGFVALFYDLHCPGCALLDVDLMDYLIQLNQKGIIDIIFVDYPVHRVEKLHAKVRVLFKKNPSQFLSTLNRIYSNMIEKGELVKDIQEVSDEEAAGELQAVNECKKLAKLVKVPGTPTIMAGRYDRNTGVALFGYDGPDSVMNLIREVIFEF